MRRGGPRAMYIHGMDGVAVEDGSKEVDRWDGLLMLRKRARLVKSANPCLLHVRWNSIVHFEALLIWDALTLGS